ncbi:hypothetical protein ASPNIDRAFT_119094 [Aspergillus niger ATCC 1015]|uniref:Zn(2)-C6 fungal-type domain-containing protein n=1 Tax=Aspergillus niger (strain ATCC 1015 / CBS 113.46 / FGSC A1144 / LSHB Ac4 / NCTC 3858a / NRRL 328 / USDA 3528.7) TaxID=380704 RepID=G3YGY5_ASPNA|nr:hypothetical protein ASPNIDRAFT_119094 [Aspergillus niger ATCC 1015]
MVLINDKKMSRNRTSARLGRPFQMHRVSTLDGQHTYGELWRPPYSSDDRYRHATAHPFSVPQAALFPNEYSVLPVPELSQLSEDDLLQDSNSNIQTPPCYHHRTEVPVHYPTLTPEQQVPALHNSDIRENKTSGICRPKAHRAQEACRRCRIDKTKCDKKRPTCERCKDQNLGCDYAVDSGLIGPREYDEDHIMELEEERGITFIVQARSQKNDACAIRTGHNLKAFDLGIDEHGSFSTDAETVRRYYQSYMNHMHKLHPFLSPTEMSAKIESFIRKYCPFEASIPGKTLNSHSTNNLPRGISDGPLKDMYDFACWTCLQLESDILADLNLPASGISHSEGRIGLPKGRALCLSQDGFSSNSMGMFIYSARIYLTKILNRLDSHLYTFERILSMNLEQWRKDLPESMTWKDTDPPSPDINVAHMRAKYYSAQYLIHRPLLYYALHHSSLGPCGRSIPVPQFSNMLVLSATYMSSLSELVDRNGLDRLLKRTIRFLQSCGRSPTLRTDAEILSEVYVKIFGEPPNIAIL